MKIIKRSILAVSLFLPSILWCQDLNIIPYPSRVEIRDGYFNLKPQTILVPGKNLESKAIQLRAYLYPATGFDLKIGSPGIRSSQIILNLNENLENLGVEGYTLEVTENKILIEALHPKGIFYAFQTLLQLLPGEIFRHAKVEDMEWNIPNCRIEDSPQFEWRGLMIDYSRTFWDKRISRKYLDAMALYKLNKLHMHLTDDQGWRVEISKYPLLTEIASKFDTSYHEPEEKEGYFSQADIKELISYASGRNIELIPEIEMPGHSSEVFSVYPELSCKGDTLKIHPFTLGPGIHKEIFCAGNDETFEFIKDVLSEIIELFPSEYVHIGGDEAPKDHWKECPECQQRITDEGLRDEHELQSWFIKQIEAYIASRGKTMIGWDEITEGGLSKTATVMYWRGWKTEMPDFVLDQGNDIIMTPTSHCYFDYTYETTSTKKVYSYSPMPGDLKQEYKEKVLGVQANYWSHLNRIEPEMDRQIFPRMLALAEVGWLGESAKDWESFVLRLNQHLRILDLLDIKYYKNEQAND